LGGFRRGFGEQRRDLGGAQAGKYIAAGLAIVIVAGVGIGSDGVFEFSCG